MHIGLLPIFNRQSTKLYKSSTIKTEIMVMDKDRERKEDFILDGEKIEEVGSFAYLGSHFSFFLFI